MALILDGWCLEIVKYCKDDRENHGIVYNLGNFDLENMADVYKLMGTILQELTDYASEEDE